MSSLHHRLQIFIFVIIVTSTGFAQAHGSLRDPPGRSSLWREFKGYKDVKINYDDNQLFCGGFGRQFYVNRGRCGVCGDPWDAYPRDNEPPYGKYAQAKIISRTYYQGQEITVRLKIETAHKGFFEFRLCPHNDFDTPASQDCLNQNLLYIKGSGYKYDFTHGVNGNHYMTLKLPDHLTCDQCVMQWRYKTGNSWGCESGKCKLGLGIQEEFYSCADVRILPGKDGDNAFNNNPQTTLAAATTVQTTKPAASTQNVPTVKTRAVTTTKPKVTSTQTLEPEQNPTRGICESTDIWVKQKIAMDMWCMINCELNHCPETHCRCTTVAYMGSSIVNPTDPDEMIEFKSYSDEPQNHIWCNTNCLRGFCPIKLCFPVSKQGKEIDPFWLSERFYVN